MDYKEEFGYGEISWRMGILINMVGFKFYCVYE